ncbi:MAG: YMGG-like glycine zipper-containing protein [Rhodospirillales bacterium]
MKQSNMILKCIVLVLAVVAVASCGQTRTDRSLSGAGIGAGAGAVGGALMGSPGTGAALGGALGGATGYFTDEDQINLGDPVWK